jgi:integrase
LGLPGTTKQSDYVADPFNTEEIQALLAHAEAQLRPLVQFAFFTGLRPSELIALEWKDIDWINGLACIRRAVVEREEKCTKTKAGKREILLLPPALSALNDQKAYTFLEGKRIFHHPRTGRPWETDRQIRNVCWERLLKKAGVRYRNPYQTRHSYASMLLSAGENMLWVARQMGHKDTEMIIRTYGKWIPDTSHKAGYKLKQDWGQVLASTCLPALADA